MWLMRDESRYQMVVLTESIKLPPCPIDPGHPAWEPVGPMIVSKIPRVRGGEMLASWAGSYVVRDGLLSRLENSGLTGFQFGPVIEQPGGVKTRVPADGFHELIITGKIGLSPKSGRVIEGKCPDCGFLTMTDILYDDSMADLSSWDGSDSCHVETTACTVVSDRAREFLQSLNLKAINLTFLKQVGDE